MHRFGSWPTPRGALAALRDRLLWSITVPLGEIRHELERLQRLVGHLYYETALQSAGRYGAGSRLAPWGFRGFSQNDEDGILEEIFRRVGVTSRTFVEIGAGEGIENNTRLLLLQGWRGAWIEGDAVRVAAIRRRYAGPVSAGVLQLGDEMVTAANVEGLLRRLGTPPEFDLLSIDIDGNDYWVWKAIGEFRPRVVVIEYNATFGPQAVWAMPHDPNHVWDRRTSRFGASLKALEQLGAEKGYALVGCNFSGVNAFFVRRDAAAGAFPGPFTAEHHWEPPRYFMELFSGHRHDWPTGT